MLLLVLFVLLSEFCVLTLFWVWVLSKKLQEVNNAKLNVSGNNNNFFFIVLPPIKCHFSTPDQWLL